MAFVVRIDRWETIGTFAGINGPLPHDSRYCLFDAWRNPGGCLRHKPAPLPSAAAGPLDGPARVKLRAEGYRHRGHPPRAAAWKSQKWSRSTPRGGSELTLR